MISNYIHQFIDTIPRNPECEIIDVVLDGGLFNGSYLAGALHFLKEMEKRGCTRVERISGCSVGSIAALLYHINALDLSEPIYNILFNEFNTKYSLDVFSKIFTLLKPRFSKDICKTMKNRVFITYYNVPLGKRIVKSRYKNITDILRTIKKSCFVPFIVNGNMVYRKKFVDGINPYIFPCQTNKRILYMNLFGYDKITHVVSVKNEQTNFHRILSGVLDIHLFYMRKSSSQMCSWVNDWNIIEQIYFYWLRYIVERLLYYTVYFFFLVKKLVPSELYNSISYYWTSKIIKNCYIQMVQKYCV